MLMDEKDFRTRHVPSRGTCTRMQAQASLNPSGPILSAPWLPKLASVGASGIPSETNLRQTSLTWRVFFKKKKTKPILLEGKSLLAAVYPLHL